MNETRKLQLHYPLSRIQEPVITRLVTEFDLEPNLLRADVDAVNGGWIVAELTGESGNIDKATEWMRSHGLEVTDAA
jgi:ABC-type methionine transport system ATPase subunit